MDSSTRPEVANPPLARKLKRLAVGGRPRVLDLFSGAGGISLGFQKAGFEIVGALEIELRWSPPAGRSGGLDKLGFGCHGGMPRRSEGVRQFKTGVR
jgi:C-5 cytosine-specific DNA methylase